MKISTLNLWLLLGMTALCAAAGRDASSAPTTGKPTPATPQCLRPRDFSIAKEVASYEGCLKLREKFCDEHEKDPNCKKWSDEAKKKRVWPKTKDVDTQGRCAIQRD